MTAHKADGAEHQHSRNTHANRSLGKCDVDCIQYHKHHRGQQAVNAEHHGHRKKIVQSNRSQRRDSKQRQDRDVNEFDQHSVALSFQPGFSYAVNGGAGERVGCRRVKEHHHH